MNDFVKDPADPFLSLMRRRYACKEYDRARTVPEDDIAFLAECARLSPSSFGIEHWHLFLCHSAGVLKALASACFDQSAVSTSPLVAVLACRKDPAYDPEGAFIAERGSRFPGGLSVFVDDYRGYYEYLRSEGIVDQWARAQCYIACANMMTGAASRGLDSCAIEGFADRKVLELLSLDPSAWQTGLLASFGYAAASDATRERIRLDPSEAHTRV